MAHSPYPAQPSQTDHLLALVYAYDPRGGGIETQFKADKSGLAMTARRKRRFSAQERLLLLLQLAHHLLVGSRAVLARLHPPLARLGIRRLVRDRFAIPGQACFDHHRHLCQIVLNHRVPLAAPLVRASPPLSWPQQLALILD